MSEFKSLPSAKRVKDRRSSKYWMDRKAMLLEWQKGYIMKHVKAHGGNVMAAARSLNLDRLSIERIIRVHKLREQYPNAFRHTRKNYNGFPNYRF